MPATPRQPHRRLLVISNATLTGADLFREIRERADETDTEVLIVAPALTSRLHYWLMDFNDGVAGAQRRLARLPRALCGGGDHRARTARGRPSAAGHR